MGWLVKLRLNRKIQIKSTDKIDKQVITDPVDLVFLPMQLPSTQEELQIGGSEKEKLKLLQRKIDLCLQIESLWSTYFPDLTLKDSLPTYLLISFIKLKRRKNCPLENKR